MLSRLQLASCIVIFHLFIAQPGHAEETTSCPEGMECIEIRLVPSTLTGDFYVDGLLLYEGKNNAIVPIIPNQKRLVQVQNIQEPSSEFGDLYIWEDARYTIHYKEGQPLQEIIINPRKTFVAGILDFSCDIPQVSGDEEVYCTITIDGVLQADQVEPGASATYFLEPGIHKVFVWSGGEQADRWRCCGRYRSWRVVNESDEPRPAYKGHIVLIWAGRIKTLTATLVKASNLVLKLDDPNLSGDIWIDGELVASQVNTADLWLPPTWHDIEVLDITSASEKDIVPVAEQNIGDILLKPGEIRVINIATTQLDPQYASWLAQVGQCFMAISGLFAIPWIFFKEPSRLDELSGLSGGGRQILPVILDIFNARLMKMDEKGLLERRSTNMILALAILTGHILFLSAILAWLTSLIMTRLTDWCVPDGVLFAVPFAILGTIEFQYFYRGRKTQTERFIDRLIAEARLRHLMGYVAMGLFFLGILLYFKATGKMLHSLPNWVSDV